VVALGRRNVAIAVSLLLVLLFSSACAGAIGPAGPVGSSGAAGGTGSPGAIGPVGQGVAGLVVLPAAQPQSHPKAKNEARAFVTLSGWGFQPGEHWMAFMELNEGAMELNTEGPTMLTNGHADERGVVYAEPWKRSKPRGLVPYSLKPGNYLVTMEGTEGTTAHATLTVLDPLPTE